MYENRIMYEECLEVRVRVESLDQLTDTLEKYFTKTAWDRQDYAYKTLKKYSKKAVRFR